MRRREFLQAGLLTPLACSAIAKTAASGPRILLRSSWQTVNIGDIAHTPGVLALIEKHIPDAQVILWASHDLSEPVMAMERRRFPNLKIVKGSIKADGKASNAELQDAVAWCDFLLHGSGPSLVAEKDVAAFVSSTGKPYGVYCITQSSPVSSTTKNLLSNAKFCFFRDSISLQVARDAGVSSPVMEFAPDGAFACDLRDDDAAEAFLKANDLEPNRFVCCLSRLRYTPYWKIRNRPFDDEAKAKHETNMRMADSDHAPLRHAIETVVKNTEMKVLVCPEDMSQMEVTKQWLVDKLDRSTLSRVVWRPTFWLPDEAISTYVRSAGIFGLEMHSPIMCIGNGVPAIVCRFEQQTSKGFMWRDIGLDDWLFDFEQPDGANGLTDAVMAMVKDSAKAMEKTDDAKRFVNKRQAESMAILRACLSARSS
jgi:polysaccharide pyruvyl transferase WcaK-like protein